MDHRKITQLRERARASRAYGEKVLATPDEMDALLDLALAQIEESREPGGPTTGDYLDELGGRMSAFARSLGGLPGWTDSPAVQAWHRNDHRTEHDGTPGKPRIWSPDYGTTERWSTPSLRNVHWSYLVDVTPLAAEQPRSLTPDDINELVRGRELQIARKIREAYEQDPRPSALRIAAAVYQGLVHEPRPEGAVELETVIGLNAGKFTNGADDVRALADLLASKGVRVVGSES